MDYIGQMNQHSAIVQGAVIAAWNIGCFVSAMATIFLGDILGRKKILMIGIVTMAIGKIIQCSSYGIGQYIAGRVIAGIGNGFNASTVPTWQAETTKAHRRGTMLMVSSGAAITLGLTLAYWIDFGLAWAQPNTVSWRFPIAAQVIWVVPAIILLPFLPESPRWLILKGREQEALEVIAALNDQEPQAEDVRQEFLQIKDAIIQMAAGGMGSAFSQGEYRNLHRTLLAVLLQVMQQFTGINLFIQYLAEVFYTQAVLNQGGGWLARLLAGCCTLVLFLASFVAVIGIDRFWGRRSLTMFGSSGMCLSMIILAIMKAINTRATNDAFTAFVFIYSAFFAIGWQGMSWLWAVELTPLSSRGPANAMATAANWLANFIVVLVTPVMFVNIGYGTYIVWACFNFAIVPIIYLFYPETGCRSLEEVDVLFHHASQTKMPWMTVVKVANNEPLWYGKDGETPFLYEQSEWHQRFARLSADSEPNSSETGYSGEKPVSDGSY